MAISRVLNIVPSFLRTRSGAGFGGEPVARPVAYRANGKHDGDFDQDPDHGSQRRSGTRPIESDRGGHGQLEEVAPPPPPPRRRPPAGDTYPPLKTLHQGR